MVTQFPQLRTAITILSVVALGVARASAQQAPPALTCTQFPPGHIQTIGVELVGGECKIDLDTQIQLLYTFAKGPAEWMVCNKCGEPVDVKIAGSGLGSLFSGFSPFIDASDTSTATNIPTGEATRFSGTAAQAGSLKYSVGVKFSRNKVGPWDVLDPELQIDSNFNFVAWLLAGLAAIVSFFSGRWFGMRSMARK